MNILTHTKSDWRSVSLSQTSQRDRDNGAQVGPDREVFHISSSYRFGTRTIKGSTRYEDNLEDVWRGSYSRPKAGDAVVDLRREGWQGVKRASIGLGVGALAGSLVGFIANPGDVGGLACGLIGGAVGAGLGAYKFDGFLGAFRDDFRCKTPIQAFTLANKVEDLAKQVATQQA